MSLFSFIPNMFTQEKISDLPANKPPEKDVSGPWPDPEIPTLDENEIMVPPWVKYPNLPKQSSGWRMGQGEAYVEEFTEWYYKNTRSQRVEIMHKYPEPKDWHGFYKGK